MAAKFRISWKAFSVPKYGNRPDENEDAFYPKAAEGNSFLSNGFSCALSDGATQTSFSSLWASLLVEETSRQPGENLSLYLPAVIENAAAKWTSSISQYELPWHATEKVKQGAFATLLWLTIIQKDATDPDGTWSLTAIGDSCLFHLRGKKLLAAHPIKSSTGFNNHPLLVSSNPTQNLAIKEKYSELVYKSVWQAKDEFWLASDAMAQCLLSVSEKGQEHFEKLHSIIGSMEQDQFAPWISNLREQNQIKNDDTTLVRVTILPVSYW